MEMPHFDSPFVVETHIDITAQTRLREQATRASEELRRVSQELTRSNEDLEHFARIASHDLSAPINSIRWLVEIFLNRHASRLDADGLKCIDQVSRTLARMSDLLAGILSHAQAGRDQISSSKLCDSGESFAIALESVESTIQSLGAVITHEPLPEVAIAPQALTQLFQNLLANALKYSKPGQHPRIHLSAAECGGTWEFVLRDNGIGIDQQSFERIFEPMQRLAPTDVPGSGLGLATCRRIVERAGGKIWVASEPGVGSNFHFTLPGA
jgi:light-regulated signal transduction histidine kinase (bacteriophytochrome)